MAVVLALGSVLPATGGAALRSVLPPPAPGPALAPILRESTAAAASLRFVPYGDTGSVAVVGVVDVGGLDALAAVDGITVQRVDRPLRFAVVRGAPAVIAALPQRPWVRYAEHLRRRSPYADPFVTMVDPQTGLPFAWQLSATRATEALATTPGDPAFVIGIVDTGADVGHPELAGKVAGTNGDVTDAIGHGTFVAAIAAGAGDNGLGAAGFGGRSRLFIAADRTFSDDSLASGMRAATDAGVRVINMSFGGPDQSGAIQDAVSYAARKGVLLVASAGNDESRTPGYPAAYLQAPGSQGARSLGLSVGASDQNGARAFFSDFGDWVSLVAPGGWSGPTCPELGVFSAVARNHNEIFDESPCVGLFGDAAGGRYAYSEGTSFSSPAVAGAAALAWSVNPRLKNFQVGDVLKLSAARAAGAGWAAEKGYGVLDVKAAVDLARNYDSVAPSAKVTVPARAWASPDVPVTWKGTDQGFDGHPASGIVSYAVTVREGAGTARVWKQGGRAGSATFRGVIGREYAFALVATDGTGNVSATSTTRVSLTLAKTRIVPSAPRLTAKAGKPIVVEGRLVALTPGAASAFSAGLDLKVLGGLASSSSSRVLGRAIATPDGAFDTTIRPLKAGRYTLVVQFPGTARLEPSFSPEIPLVVRP